MLGILLAIIFAILTAIGIFLQKIGLKKVKKWKDVIKSYKWILGYLFFIMAFFFYVFALKYERLNIIQPIANFSIIVFLIILEFVFLKKKIKNLEIFALILFFIGILIMTL